VPQIVRFPNIEGEFVVAFQRDCFEIYPPLARFSLHCERPVDGCRRHVTFAGTAWLYRLDGQTDSSRPIDIDLLTAAEFINFEKLPLP
jgi:hypothetical protein